MIERRSSAVDHMIVDDYRLKKVEILKYLRVSKNSNNNMHEEVND